jgi:hypothetical protein
MSEEDAERMVLSEERTRLKRARFRSVRSSDAVAAGATAP